MSKLDITGTCISDSLAGLISLLPYKFHFKVHKMFNLTVPVSWQIEKNRVNDDFHLLFVKGGNGAYFLQGKEEQLTRGKIVFVSSKCTYSATPDPTCPPSIIPIRFGIYSNTDFTMYQPLLEPFHFSFIPSDINTYSRMFEQLYEYYINAEMPLRAEMCSSILYQILVNIYKDMVFQKVLHVDSRIAEIKKTIDQNPSHRLTVVELASNSCLSPKHFTRLFIKYYGVTPKKYLTRAVIQYATFLLTETEMSVGEIAAHLEFPDLYTFSKMYKKVRGFPPSSLRNHT